jgi:peroxiredoxin
MRRTLILITAAMALMACSKTNFTVTATFQTSDYNGKTAYLVNYDTQDTIDSVVISNKCLQLTGTTKEPYMARLIIDGSRMMFVVESGDIAIDWGSHKVSGTPLNEKFMEFAKGGDAIDAEAEKLDSTFNGGKMAKADYDKASKALQSKMKDYYQKCYNENKDNPVGFASFMQYLFAANFNSAELNAAINAAPASYKSMTRIKKALANAKQQELTAVGKKFTDFTVKTDEGKTMKLSDYVGKGKVTLVDFWASWCPSCRAEMKNLKAIYGKYNGKGFTLLGVAVWDKPSDTKAAIKELQLPWEQIINAQTIPSDLYGFNAIPHIILFDKNGVILARGLQGEELAAKVDEAMKK